MPTVKGAKASTINKKSNALMPTLSTYVLTMQIETPSITFSMNFTLSINQQELISSLPDERLAHPFPRDSLPFPMDKTDDTLPTANQPETRSCWLT